MPCGSEDVSDNADRGRVLLNCNIVVWYIITKTIHCIPKSGYTKEMILFFDLDKVQ